MPNDGSKISHFACITDGSLAVNLGVAYLISQLVSSALERPIWVLAPEEQLESVKTFLKRLVPLYSLHFRHAEKIENDPYSLQLKFAALAEEMPRNDNLICLDYDHVIFRSDILSMSLPNDGLLLSSEITPTDIFNNCGFTNIRSFFNISLMAAKVSTFRSLGAAWTTAYEDLYSVPRRHRIEYALTLALFRTQLQGYPCESLLQSNWRFQAHYPAMFHYGGESSSSKLLKSVLEKVAHSVVDDVQLVNVTHVELIAALRTQAPKIFK